MNLGVDIRKYREICIIKSQNNMYNIFKNYLFSVLQLEQSFMEPSLKGVHSWSTLSITRPKE